MSAAVPHVPVLRDEAVKALLPGPGRRVVDGTFGFGGHARDLLEAGCDVLGLDLDADAVAAGNELADLEDRFRIQHRSFRELAEAVAEAGWERIDGLLLDLGVSSLQIDDPGKGFTYREDGPLDLRFDQEAGAPASELLAAMSAEELTTLFGEYGEERNCRRIAQTIVRTRDEQPVSTSWELRDAVRSVVGQGPHLNGVLSRVFQALRIAVNDELGALREVLDAVPPVMAPGGRLVVISYHSLEDRIVKRWMATESRDCLCPPRLPACACGHVRTMTTITRRPLKADADETRTNPRARSARLRVAERCAA